MSPIKEISQKHKSITDKKKWFTHKARQIPFQIEMSFTFAKCALKECSSSINPYEKEVYSSVLLVYLF